MIADDGLDKKPSITNVVLILMLNRVHRVLEKSLNMNVPAVP